MFPSIYNGCIIQPLTVLLNCMWVLIGFSYLHTEIVNLSQLEEAKTNAGKQLNQFKGAEIFVKQNEFPK